MFKFLHGIGASAGSYRWSVSRKTIGPHSTPKYRRDSVSTRSRRKEHRPDPPGPIEATGGIMNEDIIVRAEKIAEKYDDNFCMAASLIVQTLSDEIFDIVEAVSEDPIAMWRALVDRYERMTGSLTDHHGSHGTKSFGNYPLGNYPRGGRNGGTDHRAFRVRHVGSKKAKCHLDRRHSKASLGRPSLGALHTHSNRVSSRSGNQPGF